MEEKPAKQSLPEKFSITYVVLVAVGVWLLWRLSPILTPFLLALVLAYVCNPLVDRLESRRLPRSLGVLVVLLLLIGIVAALVLILAPLVNHETELFLERLPVVVDWFKLNGVPWLHDKLGIDLGMDAEQIKAYLVSHIKNAGNIAASLLPSLKSGGMVVMALLVNLLLVPVVFFYVLRDWHTLLAHIEKLIPRRWHEKTLGMARELDQVLSEFLRGQISVMLVMSLYYSLALHFAGLAFALPIGLVTGLLVFIPYLGMATGLTLATLAGLMQFQGLSGLLPVLVAFGIGQALEGTIVTPWLVGERIGLHPVAVIFALLAFGQIFGFFGVLLALPASAALLVGLRHLRQRYLDSDFYAE